MTTRCLWLGRGCPALSEPIGILKLQQSAISTILILFFHYHTPPFKEPIYTVLHHKDEDLEKFRLVETWIFIRRELHHIRHAEKGSLL